MIIPDVNLLLYATIDGFPLHDRARHWWEDLVNSSEQIGLTSPTVFGFVRVATNRRILAQPFDVGAALSVVGEWRARPNISFVPTSDRHLDIAVALLAEAGTAGNLTTDAQIAAHAVDQRAEVHSNDSDFARFSGVRWTNPLT